MNAIAIVVACFLTLSLDKTMAKYRFVVMDYQPTKTSIDIYLEIQTGFNNMVSIKDWVNKAKPHVNFAKSLGQRTAMFDKIQSAQTEFTLDGWETFDNFVQISEKFDYREYWPKFIKTVELNYYIRDVNSLKKLTARYPDMTTDSQIHDMIMRHDCLKAKSNDCYSWASNEAKKKYLCESGAPGCECYKLIKGGMDPNKAACKRVECQKNEKNYLPEIVVKQHCQGDIVNVNCVINKKLSAGKGLILKRNINIQFCGKDGDKVSKLKNILGDEKSKDKQQDGSIIDDIISWCQIL